MLNTTLAPTSPHLRVLGNLPEILTSGSNPSPPPEQDTFPEGTAAGGVGPELTRERERRKNKSRGCR
ncbi:hypothetical protein INR49_011479 [Caranx melampygus]|nr:hypothetical protein INR49_011479 [Caranx melampygus]